MGSLYTTGKKPEEYPKDLTVYEIGARFLADLKKNLSAHEWGKYDRVVNDLCALAGLTEAGKFSPVRLRELQVKWIQDGFSRVVINKMLFKVLRVFSWAVSYDLIPAAVLVGLKTVPTLRRGTPGVTETKPVDLVSEATVKQTLPFLPRPIQGILLLQLATGCRVGEIRNMQVKDLDRSGKVWIFRPVQHKNAWRGKAREVPIGASGQTVIKEFLKPDPDAFLFASWTGKPYEQSHLARAIRTVCKNEKIPQWAPRQIRKLVAQKAADLVGIEYASALLGHGGIALTQAVYAKNLLDKSTEAILKMEKTS